MLTRSNYILVEIIER